MSFDIEIARKNIILRGSKIEIPCPADNIENISFEDVWENGVVTANIYRGGEIAAIAGVKLPENQFVPEKHGLFGRIFRKKDEKYRYNLSGGVIFYVSISDGESSADGIIPTVTAKREVTDKYGEPTRITKDGAYYYGDVGEGIAANNRCVCVRFKDGAVSSIGVIYNV